MARRTFEEVSTITDEAAEAMDLIVSPTTSAGLATPLMNSLSDLERAAYANIAQEVGIEEYTQTEIEAMVTVEALRLTSGYGLMEVIARARYLRKIQENNMIANHPGDFHSLGDLGSYVGMSTTQISQVLDLVNIVFPFITNVLEKSVAEVWEEVGKAKLVELLPVLKVLITGEPSDTRSTQEKAERQLQDTEATWQTARADEMANMTETQLDETLRHAAAENVLEMGTLPTLEMRRQLPRRSYATHSGDRASAGRHPSGRSRIGRRSITDPSAPPERTHGSANVGLPNDPRQRQLEAARVPELRRLLRMLEGD